MNPLDQIKAHPRIAIGLGWLLSLVIVASAARFSAPLQTVTRDVVKTEYKDRVVEKVVTVHDQAEAKIETRVIYRDVEKKPDGTVIDHTVTKVGEAETKTEQTTVADAKIEAVSAVSEQTHEKTVTLRPSWAVTLQVGASLPKPWLQLYGPLVIGAEVDYRIVGGVSAGVWINTFGAAGVGLKLEF